MLSETGFLRPYICGADVPSTVPEELRSSCSSKGFPSSGNGSTYRSKKTYVSSYSKFRGHARYFPMQQYTKSIYFADKFRLVKVAINAAVKYYCGGYEHGGS